MENQDQLFQVLKKIKHYDMSIEEASKLITEIFEPKNNIEERKEIFKAKVSELWDNENWKEYENFCDHWTEHGERDRKMAFEKKPSFDISKRIKTWMRNNKAWNPEQKSIVSVFNESLDRMKQS